MKTRNLLSILCSAALAFAFTTNSQAREGGKGGGGGKAAYRPAASKGHKHAGHARKEGVANNHPKKGTWDPGVNHRQEHQKDRIQNGVRSGQLTKEERKEVGAQQKAIRQEEKEYKSDGKLTKEERKDLHQDQNAASKNIYQEKHDAEKQPRAGTCEKGHEGKGHEGKEAKKHTNHSGGGDGTNPGGHGNENGLDNPGSDNAASTDGNQ